MYIQQRKLLLIRDLCIKQVSRDFSFFNIDEFNENNGHFLCTTCIMLNCGDYTVVM